MKKEDKEKVSSPLTDGTGTKKRIFKKKRGGVVLEDKEIQEIISGRKKLKADMKAMGITSKKEFELTASSLGLYFDKKTKPILFGLFLSRFGGLIAAAFALLLMLSLWGMSIISQMKGHFTINVTDDLFKEGFSISESADFTNPTSHLFKTPVKEVLDLSITQIPEDVDNLTGDPEAHYFAYTFYLKNEGESTVGYKWEVKFNSESKNVSNAAWVMLFEDGEMRFYAKPRDDGGIEMLPSLDRTDLKGFVVPPFYDKAMYPDEQYEINRREGLIDYWRIKPYPFVSDVVAAEGEKLDVAPGDVHKYTLVVWLEGDDPDCTNDLMGGHLGFEMNMSLIEGTLE